MRHLIIPWLATFLSGCAVFGVGKVLQAIEKRKREEGKAEIERAAIIAKTQAQEERKERPDLVGLMAAVQGQGQHIGKRNVN